MFLENENYHVQLNSNDFTADIFSTIGMRADQQDSAGYDIDDESGLIVICDGMGGHEGGRQASSTAVQMLLDYYQQGSLSEDIHQGFIDAVTEIDSTVADFKNADGEPLMGGTTMVAIHIKDRMLNWVSVGDSRIYILREKELIQITEDHTYDKALKENKEFGLINDEFYQEEINRGEALISFLGIDGLPLIDCSVSPLALKSEDRVILMSDGLYKVLGDENIKKILFNFINPRDAIQALENKAEHIAQKEEISRDNTTIALIKIK